MPSCRFWRFISLASTVTVLIFQQVGIQTLVAQAQNASSYPQRRPARWTGFRLGEGNQALFPDVQSACQSFAKYHEGTPKPPPRYYSIIPGVDITGADCVTTVRTVGGETNEFTDTTFIVCPVIKAPNGREINYIYANKGVCVLPKEISQNESNQYIDTQNNGLLFRIVGTTLQKIWANRRLFLNWLKANQSLEKISKPLSHAQARQIIENARKLGMRVDVNPRGLAGQEITGQWAGIPHFKIENVHIPVQPGFVP